MSQLKVTLQDPHTLVLQEDGKRGDTIDLRSIHEVNLDTSSISQILKSLRDDDYTNNLEKEKKNIELEAKLRENEIVSRAKSALDKKDQEFANLKNSVDSTIEKAVLTAKLAYKDEEKVLEDGYRQKMSEKDKEIQKLQIQKDSSDQALISLKEMRAKMSTKMVGESLELHCEHEFNRLRSLTSLNASFAKDNDAKSGSKGDYIYREPAAGSPDQPILSIMFEMKNEVETTQKKHKNKDFFKELDKDRNEKGCEYAVLVSLLEKDNEYYDDIVTVHEYPKMFAIRPQHFITIIGLLRLANLKSQELMHTIQGLKDRNIDVTTFETNLNNFKEGFGRNYKLASSQFADAIEEIDKAIARLSKVRENLEKSARNLTLANNKLDEVSIKRLTAGSPSVAEAFANLSS